MGMLYADREKVNLPAAWGDFLAFAAEAQVSAAE